MVRTSPTPTTVFQPCAAKTLTSASALSSAPCALLNVHLYVPVSPLAGWYERTPGMPAFSSMPRATGAMKSTHGCRMKSTLSCWMSCVTAADALATSEPSSLVMSSIVHLPSMPPLALVSSIAPMVEPTMAWFGAALTPVAELTKPTLMVPPAAADGELELLVSSLELPQPPRTTAPATMTTSAISATAIHLRLLIAPPSIVWCSVGRSLRVRLDPGSTPSRGRPDAVRRRGP